MFLERAYEGKNDIGRWIAMVIIVLIVSQFIGTIPLEIMIFLKMSDNPDFEPNPENHLDLSAYDISPITGLVLMLVPFILGLIVMWLLMKPIHERPMLSVLTGHHSFRWMKFFWGAGVWFVLMTVYSFLATVTGIQKVEFQFNLSPFLTLAAVSVLLLPFQAGFEEILFRGYLLQGFSQLLKYKWLTLLVSSLLFGGLHYLNPEVKEFGAMVVMPQYIGFGIFFGICAIMDDGLELAWGVHAMNNIFLSLFFTQDASALQTPAMFRITQFNPLVDLMVLFTLAAIFIFVVGRKYQWPGWNYLLEKTINPYAKEEDLMNYMENEYDEYDEQ
jgi:uncharacterized protein